jgi:predicted  nucleic acid-binding Zn-ribbon protein
MNELLAKLKEELEKINTNTKVNEAQTAAIKELTDYVNLLIDETSANNKTDKAQDEVDELLFQQIYELIQKTDALAKEGVKLSKVQNLENKLDKELQAIKAAGVKDYSEVKDKIADLKEKDIKTDASIKKIKDDLNEAKVDSVKVDQAQNKEIAENEEDIAALRKELKEVKELVNPLYNEYANRQIRKAEKNSVSGTLKTLCIKLFKELIRFSFFFISIELFHIFLA